MTWIASFAFFNEVYIISQKNYINKSRMLHPRHNQNGIEHFYIDGMAAII